MYDLIVLVPYHCLSYQSVLCICASFPFGFEGKMYDLIVLVPYHCLSIYFKQVLLDPNPRPLPLQWFKTFVRLKVS